VSRGILFSAPLVLALLANRKTVTRRLDKRWLKLKVGDLLYVRETIRFAGTSAPRHPGGDDTVDSMPIRFFPT
jgi:hypothetical protein